MADSVLSILVKFAAIDRLTQPLRTMSGASKAASRDLAAARKDVLALEKQAAQIGGFKDQQAAIAKSHAELDTARKRVSALRAAIQQADGPTGRLTRSLEAATGKVARLDDGLQKQVTRLGTLRTGLSGAGIDVTRLADAERRLETSLTGANRKLEEQQAKIRRAGEQAAKLEQAQTRGANLRAGGVRAIGAGAVVGRATVELAGEARDFQSILVDIGQKADLGTAATRRMGRELLTVAPKIAQLPENLAAGIDTLAGLGLDARIAQRIIVPIGRAATAYKAEITDLSNATYSSIDNLKVPVNQTARALDIMAAAGKAGAFEIKDMAREFPALTAAAAGLGQKGVPAVADLAAAAQIARKGAGDSATAANNLLNLLNKINANDSIKNFSKIGIDLPKALKKAYADGKSPIEAIIELTRKATGGDLSKLPQLFGDAQVQAALRPLLQNTELYRKIRADALKANGTVEADFNNRVAVDGTAKLARYNAQLARLKITAGDQLLPALNRLLEVGGGVADRLVTWSNANPALSKGALLTVAALGALHFVAGGLFIAIGSILGPIASLGFLFSGPAANIGFLARGFQLLAAGARLALSPIAGIARGAVIGLAAIAAFVGLPVWLVGAIAVGIGLAALAIYNHWGTISRGASTLWTGLTGAFNGGLAFLRGLVPSFSQIGHALLQGLLLALNPAALVQHVIRLGGVIVGALRNVLGIKSPSRVFAAIGGHMMAGLTMGLDGGVDGPMQRLRRAGAQLAGVTALSIAPNAAVAVQPVAPINAPAPPPGGGGFGGPLRPPSSGDTYHFTINAAPGVDAEEVADRVIKKIDERQRANQRSSYQDDA